MSALNVAITNGSPDDAWRALEVFRVLHARTYQTIPNLLATAERALVQFLKGDYFHFMYFPLIVMSMQALTDLKSRLRVA